MKRFLAVSTSTLLIIGALAFTPSKQTIREVNAACDPTTVQICKDLSNRLFDLCMAVTPQTEFQWEKCFMDKLGYYLSCTSGCSREPY